MSWNSDLTILNRILAKLYPDQSSSRRIVDMAGVPPGNISFRDAAMDNWFYILKEAHNRNKVVDIVQVVFNEHPEREDIKNLFQKSTEENLLQPVEYTFLENLKSQMGEGKSEIVLKELKEVASNIGGDFETSVLMQSARLSRLKNDNLIGILSRENYKIEQARINYAILSLINEIPQEQQIRATMSTLNEERTQLITPNVAELEKVIGREELFEINWLQKALNASKNVCKVLLPSGEAGTGFIIKGGYFMTNNHVLESIEKANSAKIIFNYQIDNYGNLEIPIEYKLDTSLFATSIFKEYDYTLCKIKEGPDLPGLEIEDFQELNKDDKVNIIQHPEGKTMKIALPDKVISVWRQYLFYVADTKPGSSGSPVFNQNWKVVALHHAGKNENSTAGGLRINEAGEIRPTNRGVLLSKIIADLNSKGINI